MGFSRYIYDKAVAEKRKILLSGDARRKKEKNQLYMEFPRIKEIDSELATIGMKTCMAAFSANTNEIDELQKLSLNLQDEKSKLLKESGFSVQYECEVCKDTGIHDGKYCSCIEFLAKKIQADELSSGAPFDDCRIENFNLNFYPEESTGKISPRMRMEKNFNYIKKYVKEFPNGENLLLFGGAGLGKTHLSIAVGNEILAKGYDVYYSSADELLTKLERERYNRSNANIDVYETANNCDLLIIDDLGTEFLNNFGRAAIFNILNSRILKNKSTIINTNLSIQEIAERYTPRVSSRFIGNYTSLLFDGKDIRQIKAQMK